VYRPVFFQYTIILRPAKNKKGEQSRHLPLFMFCAARPFALSRQYRVGSNQMAEPEELVRRRGGIFIYSHLPRPYNQIMKKNGFQRGEE